MQSQSWRPRQRLAGGVRQARRATASRPSNLSPRTQPPPESREEPGKSSTANRRGRDRKRSLLNSAPRPAPLRRPVLPRREGKGGEGPWRLAEAEAGTLVLVHLCAVLQELPEKVAGRSSGP